MDATVAIPLHFTLETLGLAAAGLVLAWSFRRDAWPVALGALTFGIGQALHAGAFLSGEDDVALIIFRLVGITLLAIAIPNAPDREMFIGGLGGLFIATIWGSIAGGTVDDLIVGPHVFGGAASVLLAVWAWRATRPSVRQRVLNAFIVVLAIAIVVAGGAVARVAALDKRNQELDGLAPAAAGLRREMEQAAADLTRRAAAASPVSAGVVLDPGAEPPPLQPGSAEIGVLFDRSAKPVRTFEGGVRLDVATLSSSTAVVGALSGASSSAYSLRGTGLEIVGAAPVFRPGTTGTPADVIGAVALVTQRSVNRIEEAADLYDPDIEVALIDETSQAASDEALNNLMLPTSPGGEIASFRSVDTPEGDWPASPIRLSVDGPVLVLAVPGAEVVDATTGLMRALLIAILLSTVLAIVVALWLSARIARPMLDLADEGERLKADFLASVSHELRTPLTPIRGYTEMLRKGRVPARRATGYLDEIGQAAQRLERIVTLLIDVAAMEAGRFRIESDDHPVGELLRPAVDRWSERSRKHRVVASIPRPEPRVRADGEMVGRALDELIDNAIKFSPEGSEVSVRARRTRSGVEISVTDTGPGIDTDRREALTQAFAQASSGDERTFGGLGLGLAFVNGVLGVHGTRLVLRDSREGGTACSFTLPAGSVARVKVNARRKAQRRKPASSRAKTTSRSRKS